MRLMLKRIFCGAEQDRNHYEKLIVGAYGKLKLQSSFFFSHKVHFNPWKSQVQTIQMFIICWNVLASANPKGWISFGLKIYKSEAISKEEDFQEWRTDISCNEIYVSSFPQHKR